MTELFLVFIGGFIGFIFGIFLITLIIGGKDENNKKRITRKH